MSFQRKKRARGLAAILAALCMALFLIVPAYAETKYANWQEVASTMGTVLDGAVEAYGAGGEEAGKKATEQVNVAYYKFYEKLGFEKTVMASISGSRGSDVEHQFYLVKKVIRDGGSKEELKSSVDTLKSMLTEDAITLDGGKAAAQGGGSDTAEQQKNGAAWQTERDLRPFWSLPRLSPILSRQTAESIWLRSTSARDSACCSALYSL